MRIAESVFEDIHTCLIDYIKVFDYVQHHKLWNIIRDMEVSSIFDSFKTWFHKQQTAVRVADQNDLGHTD